MDMDEKALEAAKTGIDPNDIGRPFDEEELELIRRLKAATRGPAEFARYDPFSRRRRHPRGDRRLNAKGERIGPAWNDAVVFKDDDNKVIDLEATRFERARNYLVGKKLLGNRASNIKKLGKANRILHSA